MNKTIFAIFGPPCSGKSTLDLAIGKRFPGTYTVAYDKIKWRLSGYDRKMHRPLIESLLFGFFEVACKQGLPITLEAFMNDEAEYSRYEKVATDNGYRIVPIELQPPEDVLIARFRKRVADAKSVGKKISVTDENVYRESIGWRSFVPRGTPVFDTSKVTAEEIVDEISQMKW